MLATCVHVHGSELPRAANRAAYTRRSVFHLTRGHRYWVAGVGVFEGVTSILVRDDTGRPNWHAIDAFEIEPQPFPQSWEFTSDPEAHSTHGWTARMGYPELVRNLGHIEALIEREPAALAIFDSELDRAGG